MLEILSAIAFFVALIGTAVLVFIAVFTVISLVEIESGADPRSVLPTLNKLVTPEIAVHLAATVMLAVLLNYVEFLINLPLLYLHLSAMRAKKHLFDPTTIFSTIYAKKRASIIKLAFYMLVFFFYLFRLVSLLVNDVFADEI